MLGGIVVGVDERVRVVGRVAVHHPYGTGRRLHHDDRPSSGRRAGTSRPAGRRRARANCTVPALSTCAAEEVTEAAHLLLGRRAGEHVAVGPLDLRRTEREREVAGHFRHRSPVGYCARYLNTSSAGWHVETAATTPSAVTIGPRGLLNSRDHLAGCCSNCASSSSLAPDLPVVERHEQHDVADHQAGGELPDLTVHGSSPAMTWIGRPLRSARRIVRDRRHACQRSPGVGSSGSSPSRRADESLTGGSTARAGCSWRRATTRRSSRTAA